MYRLDREEFVQPQYVSLWSLLGFQAGFINAFGFLACGRFVSHVTGFGTQIGVALGDGNLLFALELLGFPFFFILGAFTSSLITSARIERAQRPRFELVMTILPIMLFGLMVLGRLGWFGDFGESLTRVRDFVLLFALSFVCGMQNGCFAVLTKGQIRTTHLTGISTDIGTDLARLWFGKLSPIERELTSKINFCRISTFVCFAAGSIVSVWVSQHFGYGALAVPLFTSIAVFLAVRAISRSLDQKFRSQLYAAA